MILLSAIYRDFIRSNYLASINKKTQNVSMDLGEYFYQNKNYESAFECFIETDSYSKAIESIQCLIELLDNQGDSKDIIKLLNRIPVEYANQDPKVAILKGLCYLFEEDYLHAGKFLYKALNNPNELTDKQLKRDLLIALALLEFINKSPVCIIFFRMAKHIDTEKTILDTDNIIRLLSPADIFLKNKWTDKAYLSLDESIEFISQATVYLNEITNGAFAGYEDLYHAKIYFAQGDFNKALEYSTKTIVKTMEKKHPEIRLDALFLRMRIMLFKGDYNKFYQLYSEVLDDAKKSESHIVSIIAKTIENWVYMKINDPKTIYIQYQSNRKTIYEKVTSMKSSELINHANMCIRREEYHNALGIAASMEEELHLYKNNWNVQLMVNIIKSVCFYSLDEKEKAYDHLWKAYEMTYDSNILSMYAEFGSHMRNIINNIDKHTQHDFDQDWVETIGKKASYYAKNISSVRKQYSNENETANIGDSLTKKEIEVIALMAKGFTVSEISKQIYISSSTAKKHISSVYAKLGAANRAEAIHIAAKNDII